MKFTLFLLLNYIFDPFIYLQNQHDVNVDTLAVPGLFSPIIEFNFDTSPEERFSVTKSGKIEETMDSSLMVLCTSKVIFEAIEDIEGYNEPEKIRYGLKLVRDSILFNLTWADTSGSYEKANIRLFHLKHMLLCPDKNCTDLYLDSLKI